MLDIPKYKTKPKAERFLVNHIVLLIFLGVLLYLGIYVNYWLLQTHIPELINWLFIVGIILLLIVDAIVCYTKYFNYEYVFYQDRIELNENRRKTIQVAEIKEIQYAEKMFDRWMKTGTIILTTNDGARIKLKYLNRPNQIYFFIQKLVSNNNI